MVLRICVGSACHIKGSDQVVKILQNCIKTNKLEDSVVLKATFCLGKCTEAVSVMIEGDEEVFSLSPEKTYDFFENIVKKVI